MNRLVVRSIASMLPMALLGAAHLASAAPTDSAAPAAATAPPTASAGAPAHAASDQDKVPYELGVLLSRGLDTFVLSEAEFNQVKAGLADGFHHRANFTEAKAYTPKVQALQRERAAQVALREKTAGKAYLEKAAAQPGAKRTASGLLIVPLVAGTGAAPTRTDQIKVNYEGRLIDGTVFDSSIERKQPAVLSLAGVIPCWSEAVQLMKVGGKSRIVCPSDLAYGDHGALPNINPGATLVFDVELVDIVPAAANAAPAAMPTPSPAAASAKVTSPTAQ
jgi:FKBP-type peptidyl-prolyl cis-trans isomerase FkpA/FKBP-type peptidyl-prolyl cis-trans isomerase FklB